ncbi:MAG: Stk1 family PASTA domain-containing Ser/Thr kinase [Selenomonadaceae bacterium]|nr:Stk1 family PASTA domain-containing Ser/Thr kinase [Selenomonadaceae bacterium]
MVQRILGERYELEKKIGSGGMAEVYKAHDRLLDRTVAIKILHEAYKTDSEFIEKFHREAKAAAGMSHPNIVNIYDVGIEGDDHYIVMEYVPGSTLKKKIQDEAPLDIATAVHIAKDIADGLAHAHANNIVHCDIKPHNILMTTDNRAKIADFGIARAVTESTMTYSGSVVGSVRYFSPEQARGTGITPKSDVYSLGVTLYEMLTNHLPFNGDNPVSIAMKHVEEEPPFPSVYRPQISPMLEAIVMRAMSKNPDMRPSSFEMVQELSNVEKTLGVSKEVDPDATQLLPKNESTVPARRVTNKIQNEESTDAIKKSFFHSKLFMIGLVIVLMIGFGIGAIIAFGNFTNREEVKVPEVTGKQLALARQILEDGKLRVNVAETYDASVPPGQVVSQDPEPGKTVKSERLVTIYVSKGGEDLDMPDLEGLTKSAATERIQKAGLILGSVYEKYSNEEPGTVLSHDPAKGTKISRGQTIDLTVSRGTVGGHSDQDQASSKEKSNSTATVPDVHGASLDVARAGIEGRGLTVGSITSTISEQAEGTIVSQTPSPGSEIGSGEPVDLVIAERETSEANSRSNYYESEPSESYEQPTSYNQESAEPTEVFDTTPTSNNNSESAPSRDGAVSKQR